MLLISFWRTEIWHPLSVHFPIAFLLLSTILLLISHFIKKDQQEHWQKGTSVLLFAGCITAWIAVYTGDLADGIVSRKLCDPTILKDHEIAAQTMTYLFTSAFVLNILLLLNVFGAKVKVISSYLLLILMLAGSGYLIYAGHLGSSLVYQQGAGVSNHSIDCN